MKKIILLLLVFNLGSLSAQSFIPKLSSVSDNNNIAINPIDTVKIFAVLVEFQPDDFDLTAGTGKFGTLYSKDYGNTILDPLPHDVSYFSNHLDFAKNYFSKVSGGKAQVIYSIQPQIITVDKVMRDYFPDNNGDFTNLANFAKEVWQKADSIFTNVNFSNYNLFVIFHAGTGGDVITPGSTGSEKDLPSIYLGKNSLKGIYNQDFQGFPVNSNNFFINNSLILPETESREISVIGGNVLFQLTINGLIVSSIGSHLGLPDLFNTEDGSSAISRFGLMDGQAIFAFGGLFPPEPSAWEKVFLGWETPIIISQNKDLVNIVSRLSASFEDTTLIKIPINSEEYFLIENRNRDANKNGINLTYKIGSETLTKSFNDDQNDFIYYDVSAIAGVVIDVDEYDWALPGSGIVIWHIDDGIIKDKIALNKINTDPSKRGVEVVEADGIKDIGEKFTNFLGDVIEGEGTQEDFWYSSNPSEFYINKFTPNSKPSSNAHSGANSLVSVTGFSDISNRMSFSVSFNLENVELLSSTQLGFSSSDKKLEIYSDVNNIKVFALTDATLNIFDDELNNLAEIDSFSFYKHAVAKIQNNPAAIGFFNNKINVISFNNSDLRQSVKTTNQNFTSVPVILSESPDSIEFYGGTDNGDLKKFSYNYNTNNISEIETKKIFNGEPVKYLATDNINLVAASDYTVVDSENKEIKFANKINKMFLTKDKFGEYLIVLLSGNNTFTIINKGKIQNQFSVTDSISTFSMANLFNDGENYLVFNSKDKLFAYNIIGTNALNFPINLIDENNFVGIPLVIDIDDNNQSEIINFSDNGEVNLLSGKSSENIFPFPLSSGTSVKSAGLSQFTNSTGAIFSVITENNYLINWKLKYQLKLFVSSEYGNRFNDSFIENSSNTPVVKEFFPKNRTYNWPNPVYGNETFIRTYVSEDAVVSIKIFDLAGDFIDQLQFNATGGFENEVAWDVSNIQSGAYLARVEVKSANKADYKIIKIAVVK